MKRALTIIALLAGTMVLHGQTVDTAAQIVDHYLEILGSDRLPADSTLVMETVITSPGSTDTFLMKRWYTQPQMFRIEVWRGKSIQTGMCSNGKDRFRNYNQSLGYWVDLSPYNFHLRFMSYDFRGPLYNWRSQGAELTYMGPATVIGQKGMQAVKVVMPDMYDRVYFFEPSGLMSMLVESGELDSLHTDREGVHIDWKFIHEYQQIGSSLLPKQESFLRNGVLTVLETKAYLEKRNTLIFNQD